MLSYMVPFLNCEHPIHRAICCDTVISSKYSTLLHNLKLFSLLSSHWLACKHMRTQTLVSAILV
jgi:hypothetical protein